MWRGAVTTLLLAALLGGCGEAADVPTTPTPTVEPQIADAFKHCLERQADFELAARRDDLDRCVKGVVRSLTIRPASDNDASCQYVAVLDVDQRRWQLEVCMQTAEVYSLFRLGGAYEIVGYNLSAASANQMHLGSDAGRVRGDRRADAAANVPRIAATATALAFAAATPARS